MSAIHRLVAALPNKPNKPNRSPWLKKAEQEQKGKPRNSGNDLAEGTFTMNPGNIAQELKSKSRDFQHAIQRLQFYMNRSGDNLSREDMLRLERAKEAVYRAYGRAIPKEKAR